MKKVLEPNSNGHFGCQNSPLFISSLLWGRFPLHRSDFGDLRRDLGGHFGRLGRDRMTLVIPNDRADNKLQFGFILFLFFLFFCFLSLAVWFWRVSWSWNRFSIRKCAHYLSLGWAFLFYDNVDLLAKAFLTFEKNSSRKKTQLFAN